MGFKKSVFQKTTLSLGLLVEKNVLLVSHKRPHPRTWPGKKCYLDSSNCKEINGQFLHTCMFCCFFMPLHFHLGRLAAWCFWKSRETNLFWVGAIKQKLLFDLNYIKIEIKRINLNMWQPSNWIACLLHRKINKWQNVYTVNTETKKYHYIYEVMLKVQKVVWQVS